MSPRLVLVGGPGAGKSTVGNLLAQRWNLELVDTDSLVEGQAGITVADIFITQGEDRFRELERDVVAAALSAHDGVLALGGGAILDEGTRTLLRNQPVVFLQADPSDASARIGLNRDRPLLLGNVRGQLMALMAQRLEFYTSVAKWSVDTSGLNPDQVADAVESLMESSHQVDPQEAQS